MFRIPTFYQEDVTFECAKKLMSMHGRGDLLEGMEAMKRSWKEYCASCLNPDARYECDEDWFDDYAAEANAFNKVFSTMQPLFAGAA